MSELPFTLYRLQACPFCERVVRTLDDLGLPYRSRFVEAMHSDRDVVKRLSGSRTVPVLVDDDKGVTLTESANIVNYLETTYGETGESGRSDERQPSPADEADTVGGVAPRSGGSPEATRAAEEGDG